MNLVDPIAIQRIEAAFEFSVRLHVAWIHVLRPRWALRSSLKLARAFKLPS